MSVIDPIKEKREKQNKIREYHQATFDKLKISNPKFIAKFAYIPLGKTEKYITFFENEINHGADIYTEFADREFNLQSTTHRELYKVRYNPHYNTEYEKLPAIEEGKTDRYMIPIAELILIKRDGLIPELPFEDNLVIDSSPKLKPKTISNMILTDPNMDLPMDQMTMRDFAAIITGKPYSTKKWLNEILESK